MSIIEKTIDVNIPARTAYNQWTQFEEFPRFMDGVLEVRQLDDKRTHWPTNIGGIEKDFDAEITEQILDKGIAWRSRSGASNTGVVTLHSLNDQNTRIMLQMFSEPEWIIEKRVVTCLASLPGDLRVASSDSKSSSSRKAARPGAWRGKIERPV
jgi:uncharacterized membrane protein